VHGNSLYYTCTLHDELNNAGIVGMQLSYANLRQYSSVFASAEKRKPRQPSRHLGFGETGDSAIRSADLENPKVEPNMKWIG